MDTENLVEMNCEPETLAVARRLCIHIDDRERYASEFIDEHGVPYKIRRLEIGDFCIMDEFDENVRAIFERKTLADQAASIRDGRHDNKQKMMDMRTRLGCDVYYIIESDRVYCDDSMVNGIMYKIILNSISHLIVRDRIHVLYSRSPRDTIRLMCDMLSAYEKYKPVESAAKDVSGTPALKTITEDIKDAKTLRAMWCAIPGISSTLCDKFLKYRLVDVFARNTNALSSIDDIRYESGRKLPGHVLDEIRDISKPSMVRVMSVVRGITPETAAILCDAISDWSTCTPSQISIIKNNNNRKVGAFGIHMLKLLNMRDDSK